MTIILFLVDTSASMSQRTYLGARPTLLDVAKDAIEKFLKLRQKDPASRQDRYMLLTFEEPPFNVKAGWKEHHNAFMTELKNLTATGMTTLGPSLKHSFDLLNLNRMQTGIDTYGQGRCPFYLEPSIIIVITDGGKMSNSGGIQEALTLPMHSSVPGSELTKEPFRWDQRLFALVLRLTGTVPVTDNLLPSSNLPACDDSPIDSMCNVTGGRSYSVTSQRSLINCLDNIVSKVQGGVVINFEKVGADPLPISPSDESLPGIASIDSNGSRLMSLDKENTSTGTLLQGALMSPSNSNQISLGLCEVATSNGFNGILDDSSSTSCDKNNKTDTNNSWSSCRKMIYVQRSAQKGYSVGHWPIPESFWPDLSAPSLPARSAHPCVKFTCIDTIPMTIDNLPFDKYELEPCPLTKVILSRRNPHISWQCYVSNSSKNSSSTDSGGLGHPFGYLKASSNMASVNLFVLPYNYPALLPLLDDLIKNQIGHNMKPTREWKIAFETYLMNLPAYYVAPLKRALCKMGAGPIINNLIPEQMETCLSYQVLNYLKRLKNQAKAEFDKIVVSVNNGVGGNNLASVRLASPVPESIRVVNPPKTKKIQDMVLMSCFNEKNADASIKSSGRHNLSYRYHERFDKMKPEINDFQGFVTRVKDKYSDNSLKTLQTSSYRNPYDIHRHELIDQIYRMRANFLLPVGSYKLQDEDQMHSLPVSQMGNYQEYLKRCPTPLRELESAPTRQHMFGNPFKIDKRGANNSVAGVPMEDIDLVGSEGGAATGSGGAALPVRSPKRSYGGSDGGNPNRNKRKPGPLPKDYTLNLRPISPPIGAPPSMGESIGGTVSPPPPPPLMSMSNVSNPLLPPGLVACDRDPRLTPPIELMDTRPANTFQTIDQQMETGSGPMVIDIIDEDDDNSVDADFDQVMVSGLSPASASPDSGFDDEAAIDESQQQLRLNCDGDNYKTEPNIGDEEEDSYSLMNRDNKQIEYEPSTPINGTNLRTKLNSNQFDYAKANGTGSRPSPSTSPGLTSASPALNMNSFSYPINGTKIRVPLKPEELEVKKRVLKLVKVPGKNYDKLIESINLISNPSFKSYIVNEVKSEASRFKRKHLVNCLINKLSSATPPPSQQLTNHMNHHPEPISSNEMSRTRNARESTATAINKKNPLLKSYVSD